MDINSHPPIPVKKLTHFFVERVVKAENYLKQLKNTPKNFNVKTFVLYLRTIIQAMVTQEKKAHTAAINAANKAIRIYIRKIDKSTGSKIKSEEFTYSDFFENKMLIIRVIRAGIPYKLFSKIKDITPFSEDDWAEFLNLSKKTLQRYSTDDEFLFKPIHAEKIIELAEVTNFGKEIFDSSEQFYLWLNTPSFALGNLKPAELLKDSYGKELVMAELNRIDHGIFA